jgi:hypothetical protein
MNPETFQQLKDYVAQQKQIGASESDLRELIKREGGWSDRDLNPVFQQSSTLSPIHEISLENNDPKTHIRSRKLNVYRAWSVITLTLTLIFYILGISSGWLIFMIPGLMWLMALTHLLLIVFLFQTLRHETNKFVRASWLGLLVLAVGTLFTPLSVGPLLVNTLIGPNTNQAPHSELPTVPRRAMESL